MSEQGWHCGGCGSAWSGLRKFCGECGAKRPEVKAAVSEDDKRAIEELVKAHLGREVGLYVDPFDDWTQAGKADGISLLAKARELLGKEAAAMRAKLEEWRGKLDDARSSAVQRETRLQGQFDEAIRQRDELRRKLAERESAKPSGDFLDEIVAKRTQGNPQFPAMVAEASNAAKPVVRPKCHGDEADLCAAKVRRETCPENAAQPPSDLAAFAGPEVREAPLAKSAAGSAKDGPRMERLEREMHNWGLADDEQGERVTRDLREAARLDAVNYALIVARAERERGKSESK